MPDRNGVRVWFEGEAGKRASGLNFHMVIQKLWLNMECLSIDSGMDAPIRLKMLRHIDTDSDEFDNYNHGSRAARLWTATKPAKQFFFVLLLRSAFHCESCYSYHYYLCVENV